MSEQVPSGNPTDGKRRRRLYTLPLPSDENQRKRLLKQFIERNPSENLINRLIASMDVSEIPTLPEAPPEE